MPHGILWDSGGWHFVTVPELRLTVNMSSDPMEEHSHQLKMGESKIGGTWDHHVKWSESDMEI